MDLAPSERLAQGPGDLFRPSPQGLPVMNPHGLIPDTAGDFRSRRGFLRAGAAGALGLTMGDGRAFSALALRPIAPARAVILLWLWGGPSHLDTFDMKPDAPLEYRGPFEPIATTVPGLQVCELLPGLARRADKFALLRAHAPRVERPRRRRDDRADREHRRGGGARRRRTPAPPRPSTGAIVGRLHRGRPGALPPYVILGNPLHQGLKRVVGEGGGSLGSAYRPVPPRLRAGRRPEAARRRTCPRASTAARLGARWDLLRQPRRGSPPGDALGPRGLRRGITSWRTR